MNKNHSANKIYKKKQNLFNTKKYENLGLAKRLKAYDTFKKGFN